MLQVSKKQAPRQHKHPMESLSTFLPLWLQVRLHHSLSASMFPHIYTFVSPTGFKLFTNSML